MNIETYFAHSKNPALFMEDNFFAFNAFTKSHTKIKPFDYQLEILNKFHEGQKSLILKSRQMHITSTIALYLAWYVIFNQDKSVGIIGLNSESGKHILSLIKCVIRNYSFTRDDIKTDNKTELILKNLSRIKVFSPNYQSACGESLDLLYIDEAAFIKNFDEIWATFIACLYHTKGKCIIVSTPNDNSFFNKLYLDSIDDKNDFVTMKLHWSIHPEYSKGIKKSNKNSPFKFTSSYFEEVCKGLNYDKNIIETELECVVNHKDKINKEKTISLRLDFDLYNKVKSRVSSNDTVSDYIRKLIEKDCQDIPDKL